MRRLGAYLLLPLALTACGEDAPTYADGEEVAREVLKCDEVLTTTDTVTGPDTGCRIDDAHVSIWEWGTAEDDYRRMYLSQWEDAGYITFEVGDEFSVLVRSTEDEETLEKIRERLE